MLLPYQPHGVAVLSDCDVVQVDILDGLIVALDLLFRRTDGKKYDKRLMVITDAAAKIADAGDLESIVAMIQNMEVNLQVMYAFDSVCVTMR